MYKNNLKYGQVDIGSFDCGDGINVFASPSNFNNSVYFNNLVYFNSESYLNRLEGGGIYCSNNLYVNGNLSVSNLSVAGIGVIKQLSDGGHSISMGWAGSELQVLVDSTYFTLVTKNMQESHTYSGTYYMVFPGTSGDTNVPTIGWVKAKIENEISKLNL